MVLASAPCGGSRRRIPNALLARCLGGPRQRWRQSLLASPPCHLLSSLRALRGHRLSKLGVQWPSAAALARPVAPSSGQAWRCRSQQVQAARRLLAAPALQRAVVSVALLVGRLSHQSFSHRCSSLRLPSAGLASHQVLLPNPSLVGTSTGKALGPRTGQCHHPSRGPSAVPASAPQLIR